MTASCKRVNTLFFLFAILFALTTVTPAAAADFTLTASPSTISIGQQGTGTLTLTTTVSGGFNNSIALSASGLPMGVTASFNPVTIPAPGAGNAIMTLNVIRLAPLGTYPITVTGNGGTVQHSITISLTITTAKPSFTLSVSPGSLTVAQGNQGTATVTTTISGGFNNSIALSASGAPTGTTLAFSPQTIPAPGNGTSTLSVTVASNTPTGTYPIIVSGLGGGVQQYALIMLTVTSGGPNFTISISPTSETIPQGGQGTATVTVTISGGFNNSVSFSASGVPTYTTVGFTPNPLPAPGSGTSSMVINVGNNTPIGTYPITVTATGGSIHQTATFTLTVTQGNFALSASPSSLSVAQGGQGTTTITTTVSGGFNNSISLSASGLPSGTTANFNPPTIPAPGNGNSVMTITVGNNTPLGTYPITVTGSGGGKQQNTTVTLTVTSTGTFTISANPTTIYIQKGNQGFSTITTTVSGGFNSSIILSTSGVPTGVTVGFAPNPIPAPGSGTSSMVINVLSNAAVGTYPIIVTGSGGNIQQSTTVTLVVAQGSFSLSASPSSVSVAEGGQGTSTITSTISGGFNYDVTLAASGLPTGTTASFSPNPITAPGSGNSTITINVGSNTPVGTYPITVTGVGGGTQNTTTVTLTVTPGFSLSASPSSVAIAQGSQGTSTITATISNGFNSAINLSASGQPSGVTLALNPTTIPAPGNGTSALTITVGSGTQLGVYTITVTGNGGGTQQTTTVTLTVTSPGNFTISANPSTLYIQKGNQDVSVITTTVSGGFNNSINLSATGVPTGTNVGFAPNPISAPGNGNSSMVINVGSTTAVGTYPITVTGSGGNIQHTTIVTLVVTQGSFSLSASPPSLSVAEGGQGTSTITSTISGGFNYDINFSYSGTPIGTTVSFSPNPLTAPGSGSTTMTITVGSNTPVGTYPITVTGIGGGIQKTTTVTLTVTQGFSLSASPASVAIAQGSQGTSTITATISNGFNSSIALTATGAPAGTNVGFAPNPISAPGSGSSSMVINVGSNTPVGTYPITVTGSGGNMQHTTIVTLTVTQGGFTVSASPSSLSIPEGNQGISIITTTISGGFNYPISFTTSAMPTGLTASYAPNPIPAPGNGTSTMTIIVGSNTPVGTYPITVTASGGGIYQTTTVTVTVTAGFSMSASPAAVAIAQGSQGTSTITTTISSGFNSSIALTASGAPTGTTLALNPQTIPAPGNGTSTLTITVASNTPQGVYPITVTGNGGGTQQTTTVTLTVTSPGSFTLTANPTTLYVQKGNQGISSITLTVSGGFNNQITLSATGLPTGTTGGFAPNPIKAPGMGKSSFVINVGSTTAVGTYPITVTGTGGNMQQTATVTLNVTQGSFSLSASPSSVTIAAGGQGSSAITSTISGGFNYDINFSASGVPTGTTVNFTPNPIPAPGSGTTSMGITVGSTTPVGTYPITVTGIGGGIQKTTTVTLTVTQGFTLSASPASVAIAQGSQGTSTITATISNGFNSSIALTASGAPSGTTLALNPQTIPAPGNGSSTLTITVGSGTPLGVYPITVTGNGGGTQSSTMVTLTVTSPGDFTISANPSSLSIPLGNQSSSTITTTVSGGFNNNIGLSASGMPTGTNVGFAPNPIAAPGAGNSSMVINVGSSTAVGTYPITVTGSGGNIQHTTIVTLTVTQGGFTVSASPSSLSIPEGNQGISILTTTVSGGFNYPISFSTSGMPSGLTASYAPNPIPAPGSGMSTMTISVGSNVPVGTYPITVTANGGGIYQTTTVTVTVTAGFSMSASPSSIAIAQGSQGTSTITTTISNGFNSSIALTASGAPNGTTLALNPPTIPAPGNGTSTLTITVGGSTPQGVYNIIVTGNGGGTQQTTTVILTVTSPGNFTISANPTTLTIPQGNQGVSTITTTVSGGFNNNITLSATGMPTGTTVGFAPNPIPAPGSGTSGMVVNVGATTPVGTYPIIVTGTGGNMQQTTTVTLIVTQGTFTVTATPSTLTIPQGSQGTSTITTAISGGFNNPISLSASGAPSGANISFNPQTIPAPGNGTSIMTVTLSSNTPQGTYTITITGTGGGQQQGTTLTLIVISPGNFTISAAPSSLSIPQGYQNSVTITATVSGGFNNAISLSAAGVPTGTIVQFSPNPIPAPGSGNSAMNITVGSNTPLGTYPIVVTGSGGGIQQNVTVTLTVTTGSFSISASPTSLTIPQGNQNTSTITTTVSGGFNYPVSLSTSGVPNGTNVTFDPQTIPAPGSGTSTMTISVSINTPVGTYPITVTGTGGGVQQYTTVTLTVTQGSFTLTPWPASLTVPQGAQGSPTITVAISGGFNSPISLTSSGAPSGTTVAFNPPTMPAPGSGTSAMTISVGNNTPVGTYTITVTGNGGGVQQYTTVTLTVSSSGGQPNFTVSVAPNSINLQQGHQGNSTVTSAISGGFNSSISLSATGAPTGVSVSFNPQTIGAPGAGTSTMTITVSSSTFTGAYPITITGSGGGLQRTATFLLMVSTAEASAMPFPTPPRVYVDTTWNPPAGTVWNPHNATEFTNALNNSQPGDTIILDAGTAYIGNFVLPAKNNPNNQWIYIQSSALDQLPPPGTRVSQSDAVNMPQIITNTVAPALSPQAGADHWRMVGLEVTSNSGLYTYFLFGWDSNSSNLPDSMTIDRCYMHGSPTQDVEEGVQANGSNYAVIDSYISDIHWQAQDSQAILAYWTPGPIKIVNNFLSATTEDIMFGGGGGPNNPYVPSDIEIRRNHLWKNPSWDSCGTGGTVPINGLLPDGSQCLVNPEWSEKNNLEFKSAQRVVATGNILENTWVAGQFGYSVLFTVRTSQSGNNAVVDDIFFQSNQMINVDAGFETLEYDNGCLLPACSDPGETRRIWVNNNQVLLSLNKDSGSHTGLAVSTDLTDFVFQHNTVKMIDGSAPYSMWFESNQSGCPPTGNNYTHNMWVLDNALLRQPLGDCFSNGNSASGGIYLLNAYMPDPANPTLAQRYYGNAMYVANGEVAQTWPGTSNDATTTTFQFDSNGQLLVPAWLITTDGYISGINSSVLQQEMNP